MPQEFYVSGRKKQAFDRRTEATRLSFDGDFPVHKYSDDEDKYPYIFSFTKGLTHGTNGLLVDTEDYKDFQKGTQNASPAVFGKVDLHNSTFLTAARSDFEALDCPKDRDRVYREWESPTAGFAGVLEGPDPFALTMPPVPTVGSAEFAAEMAEIYIMALTRDWPVAAFMDSSLVSGLKTKTGKAPSKENKAELDAIDVQEQASLLGRMSWFKGGSNGLDTKSGEERSRRRFGKPVTPGNLFRGAGEDGWATPFLSQFLVMGNGDCTDNAKKRTQSRASGLISYGAQRIDQRVRVAVPNKNYMTKWEDWLDVQNALNKRALVNNAEFEGDKRRLISRQRDLATYVHDDQLYQAYFNAALILLGEKFSFDADIPYHGDTANPAPGSNREPFALFGNPHLLTLVTEVSSRALRAVRLQKFGVHRRMRPEAAGALFHTVFTGYHPQRDLSGANKGSEYDTDTSTAEGKARHLMANRIAPYTHPFDTSGTSLGSEPALSDILSMVLQSNEDDTGQKTWLLPMAFPEGSPMHPAYGAGHATVAGACVTLLKAFFAMQDPMDASKPVYLVEPGTDALVPSPGIDASDDHIENLFVKIGRGLTLEGELNKLIWNISNARNIAGVHYYTDYIESALLGEAITIGILREQMMSYQPDEQVGMTVPLLVPRTLPPMLLEGSDIAPDQYVEAVKIRSDGTLGAASPTAGRD